MENNTKSLQDFHHDGHRWTGHAFVPFWQGDLTFYLHTYKHQPTARQLRMVPTILEYPHDLRPSFEKSVFEYYQKEVYGASDYGSPEEDEAHAPLLAKSSEIWKLIPGAAIVISDLFDDEDAVEFKLTFDCTWDEEHGFGVKYQDWKIVEFTGWND